MTIDTELKKSLIADVENVCRLELTEEQRTSLERCFEITIGTRNKALGLHVVSGMCECEQPVDAGSDRPDVFHKCSKCGKFID